MFCKNYSSDWGHGLLFKYLFYFAFLLITVSLCCSFQCNDIFLFSQEVGK